MALKRLFRLQKITKIAPQRPFFVMRFSSINLFSTIDITRESATAIEKPPMIKIMATKPIVSLVSFIIFVQKYKKYKSTPVINKIVIIIPKEPGHAPLNFVPTNLNLQ